MPCKNAENCVFYNSAKNVAGSKSYQLLVGSYCEGQLQSICRRVQYEEEFSKGAPEDLAPNGYLFGTHNKLKTKSTRRHKRYAVKKGACLLEISESNKTLSADFIDLSKGGAKLALKFDLGEINVDSKKVIFRILGYTVEGVPIPITKEFLKMVWQKDQIIGCAFLPSPTLP